MNACLLLDKSRTLTLVVLFLIAVLPAEASEVPAEEVIRIIESLASSYEDTGFHGTLLHTIRRPPPTEQQIMEEIDRINQVLNPTNSLLEKARIAQNVRKTAVQLQHRLQKVRCWRKGDFQRIDYLFGSPDDPEGLLGTPFEEGDSTIYFGRDERIYYIDHRRKLILYRKRRSKIHDDFVDLVMPFKRVADRIRNTRRFLEVAKDFELLIGKDPSRSDKNRDCIYLSTRQKGGETIVRTELEIRWDKTEPIIIRLELISNGKTAELRKYQDYAFNEAFGRTLPRRLFVKAKDERTGGFFKEDVYEVLELLPGADPEIDGMRMLKGEWSSYEFDEFSATSSPGG